MPPVFRLSIFKTPPEKTLMRIYPPPPPPQCSGFFRNHSNLVIDYSFRNTYLLKTNIKTTALVYYYYFLINEIISFNQIPVTKLKLITNWLTKKSFEFKKSWVKNILKVDDPTQIATRSKCDNPFQNNLKLQPILSGAWRVVTQVKWHWLIGDPTQVATLSKWKNS